MNLVSIGIFSWAKLQSVLGVFHFEWLDRLMDLLAENGIAVDIATATVPRTTLENGTRLSQDSRQHSSWRGSSRLTIASGRRIWISRVWIFILSRQVH